VVAPVSLDIDRITEQVNALWDSHGAQMLLAAGLATAVLVIYTVVRVVRARQRSRIVATVTALVVLAWTSEGLWEVARDTLGLPVLFTVMTFFVFESMMITAGMQAEEHRKRYGSPGRAGAFVWLVAAAMATVVGLNATTLVEAVVRMVLPLLVAGLWWVAVTAPRDSDTDEVKAAREAERKRREATWAITPQTVLVWARVMRPGSRSATEAERESRRNRMVVHADRLRTADPDSHQGRMVAWRLRRLARKATADDVAAVIEQVELVDGIVARIEAIGDAEGVNEVDMAGGRDQWTRPAPRGGRRSRTATPGAAANQVDIFTSRQRRLMDALAAATDHRPTHRQLGRHLRVSPKTVQRELTALRRAHQVRSDDQLWDIATGRVVDRGLDKPGDTRVDTDTGLAVGTDVDLVGHLNGQVRDG
jgi:hypothetical protein